MYKRHKVAVTVLFVVVLVTTYLAESDYGKIAETAIAVIAIALGCICRRGFSNSGK